MIPETFYFVAYEVYQRTGEDAVTITDRGHTLFRLRIPAIQTAEEMQDISASILSDVKRNPARANMEGLTVRLTCVSRL